MRRVSTSLLVILAVAGATVMISPGAEAKAKTIKVAQSDNRQQPAAANIPDAVPAILTADQQAQRAEVIDEAKKKVAGGTRDISDDASAVSAKPVDAVCIAGCYQ